MLYLATSEEWRPILGAPDYEVSSLGQVRSYKRWGGGMYRASETVDTPRLLRPKLGKRGKGYLSVALAVQGRKKHLRVNRLVALAFLPNPDNLPEVGHRDNNKLNNRVDNLEWTTQVDNTLHTFVSGVRSFALTPAQMIEARRRYLCPCVVAYGRKRKNCPHGNTIMDLAEEFGTAFQNIWQIVNGFHGEVVERALG